MFKKNRGLLRATCPEQSRGKSRGFTLIELLVVIFIIGLLASIVIVSVNTARMRARDTKRKADIQALKKAVEMYNDATGHYPNSGRVADCWQARTSNWIPDSGNYGWSQPTYLAEIQPHDANGACCWPWDNDCNPNGGGTYEYFSDGNQYIISARMENHNDAQINGNLIYHPFGLTNETYTAYSVRNFGANHGNFCYVVRD